MAKIFYCPKCGARLYHFSSDKDGDLCMCIECGTKFAIDLSKLVDEFAEDSE